ncbi:hypothetical protein [Psychrobacter sp. I-STPA10]|uniref:hypothetical protein n=1 Tax=Psychrobacter sp. I-STPA10 TaxID=2585769 RepID=UPI001E558787|nr:hypothetical protein [Psychrobacter sp. I-STPA10]
MTDEMLNSQDDNWQQMLEEEERKKQEEEAQAQAAFHDSGMASDFYPDYDCKYHLELQAQQLSGLQALQSTAQLLDPTNQELMQMFGGV